MAVHFSCHRQNDILSDSQNKAGERCDPQKLFCVDSAKAGEQAYGSDQQDNPADPEKVGSAV